MTPADVISVAQWVLLILICYLVLAIASLLVTFLLKRLWWQLKVGVTLVCFGLILVDHNVNMETRAIRLVCLVFVCILLSIRSWKDRTMAARIVHLEEQVKILKSKSREMESWRIRCVILSCCLVLVCCILCLVVYLALRVYFAIHNSEYLEETVRNSLYEEILKLEG